MSLTNLIADKSAQAALANNRTLPKFTTTTYAQSGTSLIKISDDAFKAASDAVANSGGSDDKFNEPIRSMQQAASTADPSNADAYAKAAQSSMSAITDTAASQLNGFSNSLYDLQKATREAVSSAVNNFGSAVNKINPAISSSITNVGISSLNDTGRILDASCTASYNAAASSVSSSVADVHNAIAEKAKAEYDATEMVRGSTSIVDLPKSNGDIISAAVADAKFELILTTKEIREGDEGDIPGEGVNTTDVIYQEVKIYVEGVQVPFESASISQAIGQLPTASFQIPPASGLMDIVRYYQPKVHIFYTDNNTGGDRLLFWGHIIACNYSRSQTNGSATISFECIHKNALIQQLTFEWSAGGAANVTNGGSQTDTNPNQAGVQLNNFNSEASLIRALQGISGVVEEDKDVIDPSNKDVINADPVKLQKRFEKFEKRIMGMPSSIMNLWNQAKLEIYSNEKLNAIFSKMYVPLIEEGLRFFDRLSGHYHLEKQIHETRVEHCNDHSRPELSKYKTMLPPSYRLDIMSAVQTKLAVASLKNSLGFSGEMISFLDLFMNFYFGIEYEMLTLASPAEVPLDPAAVIDPDNLESWRLQERTAIETIIKPQLPFYYAPICNVILPNMHHTISVQQNEMDIPTRVTAVGTAPAQATNQPELTGLNYRAPHSIREAIAVGRTKLGISKNDNSPVNLRDTTGSSYNIPGKYELGRGIRNKKIAMPDWLSHFTIDEDRKRDAKSDEQLPQTGSLEYKNLVNLHLAWIERYGYKYVYDNDQGETSRNRDRRLDTLNPYSRKSEIMAYERLLFSAADYEYTKDSVRSKNGTVECLFNPYIVPGYPMDIIDPSPNNPSFHAMCASVTHSISSRNIGTTVSFVAAITYTEMSNYYMQPVHPWLRNALSLVNVERSEYLTDGGNTDEDVADVNSAKVDPVTENANTSKDKTFKEEDAKQKQSQSKKQELSTAYGITPDPVYDTYQGDVVRGGVKEGLINNDRAKQAADNFYRSVFGIGAADPGLIYDFESGGPKAIKRSNGVWVGDTSEKRPTLNGGEGNDNLTGVGNLRLVSRPIEGKKSIEHKFSINFIELTPENYSGSLQYYENDIATSADLLEPGASLFLDYEDVDVFLDRSDKGQTEI